MSHEILDGQFSDADEESESSTRPCKQLPISPRNSHDDILDEENWDESGEHNLITFNEEEEEEDSDMEEFYYDMDSNSLNNVDTPYHPMTACPFKFHLARQNMRLVMVGHSYVGDISQMAFTHLNVGATHLSIDYIYRSKSTYETFLRNPECLDPLFKNPPEFVLVIIAGNCIKRNNTNQDTYHSCRKFYELLRTNLPGTHIISAQAELRFPTPCNRFIAKNYATRRSSYNSILRRVKYKDCVMLVGGSGRLDDPEWYKQDRVHLNHSGLARYIQIITGTLTNILSPS